MTMRAKPSPRSIPPTHLQALCISQDHLGSWECLHRMQAETSETAVSLLAGKECRITPANTRTAQTAVAILLSQSELSSTDAIAF